MINNRQTGRRRGRGGQQQRPQGNSGRQDNGNRIDNRARGNAAQLLEKYKSLARDSQMQGDRVNTEYYLQFADHYFRVLAETRSRFEENRRQNGGPAFDSGFDSDDQEYDDDGEPVARVEQPRQDAQRYEGQRNDTQRGDGQRGEGQRGDSPRYEGQRGDQRGEAPRGDNQRGENQRTEPQRGDSQRGDARRDESRPGRDARNQRYAAEGPADQARGNGSVDAGEFAAEDQSQAGRVTYEDQGRAEVTGLDREGAERRTRRSPRAAQATSVESDASEVATAADVPNEEATPTEAPRRRGRPRRVVEVEEAPLFEADRLPPALGVTALSDDEIAEEKPRRRRGRPAAAETSSAN